MNITITGNLGSGKTSVCKELKKYGFTVVSAGDIFRDLAAEKGMTVIELNEAAKSDRTIDDMLDNRSAELGKKMDHTVFDSRLAWHFVENSFKVFLLVDVQEAARRVFEGDNRSAEAYQNIEEARAGLEERAKLEQARFADLYQLDYYDGSNYDLIIESSCASPQQIAQEIKRNYELYDAEPFPTKVELNLRNLFPTKYDTDMDYRAFTDNLQKGQKENQTLCTDEPSSITIKNGYNYLLDEYHTVLSAIAAGKVFTEIKEIRLDPASQEQVKTLSMKEIHDLELAGNFQYLVNPVMMPEKAGYMVDFLKVLL